MFMVLDLLEYWIELVTSGTLCIKLCSQLEYSIGVVEASKLIDHMVQSVVGIPITFRMSVHVSPFVYTYYVS